MTYTLETEIGIDNSGVFIIFFDVVKIYSGLIIFIITFWFPNS